MLYLQKTTLIIIFLVLGTAALSAQSVESVIKSLAVELADQMQRERPKKAAITRLSYKGNDNSAIGRYFADELSFAMVQIRPKFDIVTLSQWEEAVAEHEAEERKKKMQQQPATTNNVNPQQNNASDSGENLDLVTVGAVAAAVGALAIFGGGSKSPMQGVKMTVGGNIVDEGEELVVTYEAYNKKGVTVSTTRARFVKTPKMINLINQSAVANRGGGAPPAPPAGGAGAPGGYNTPITNDAIVWKNNNIHIEVESCAQNGQNLECVLQVTARQQNTDLYIKSQGTVLFAASNQKEYYPSEIVIVDKSTSGGNVQKTIIAGYNAKLVIRFGNLNQRVDNIAALAINAWGTKSGSFVAQLNNIPVY